MKEVNIIDMQTTSQKHASQNRQLDRARTARRGPERVESQGRVWVGARPPGQPPQRFAHLYESYTG